MSREILRERFIEDIGVRPHNLSHSQIVGKIKNTKNEQFGVLMLKPDCFSIEKPSTPPQKKVEKLINSSYLDVLTTTCTILNEEQLHLLYPDIFDSNVIANSDKLEELRQSLEEYMTEKCIISYLVSGKDVSVKLEVIKHYIRKDLGYIKGSINVHNYIHVPEQEELIQDINILFKDNNCSDCLLK